MGQLLNIAEADIEEAASAAAKTRRAPWYVEMFLAFGGWVAGLLAAGAIVAFVAAVMPDIKQDEAPALLAFFIGLGFIAFGVRVGRNSGGEFSRHFAIASIAAGLTAASGGFWFFLYSITGGDEHSELRAGLSGFATSALFAVGGYFIATRVKDGILTFLTTLAFYALFAISTKILEDKFAAVAIARWLMAPVSLLAGLYLFTSPIARRVHASAGAALMMAPMLHFEILRNAAFMHEKAPALVVAYASEAAFAAAILYCINALRGRYPAPALIAASVMLLAASWFLPNAGSVAIVLICAGFAANHRGLAGVGVIALAWFIGRFYYDLSMTLLEKSALMAALGAVTLGGALALRAMGRRAAATTEGADAGVSARRRSALAALAFAALLIGAAGLVNRSVMDLESAFKEARVIYLPLGPVDPRSLIQGDYMRLRFRETIYPGNEVASGMAKSGQVFLKLDADDVATFSRLASVGDTPASDEIRANYTKNASGDIRYCPESFFFQEGEAELFATARFAAIRIAPDGRTRLFALADEERKIITPETE